MKNTASLVILLLFQVEMPNRELQKEACEEKDKALLNFAGFYSEIENRCYCTDISLDREILRKTHASTFHRALWI